MMFRGCRVWRTIGFRQTFESGRSPARESGSGRRASPHVVGPIPGEGRDEISRVAADLGNRRFHRGHGAGASDSFGVSMCDSPGFGIERPACGRCERGRGE
jgi:hypothetical protein